ncbi:MAG: tetratricopeptide repeat protein [Candidatus Thorarchaeota archaeon]
MSESKLESKPEELVHVEQLVVEGKYKQAHQLIDKFLESGKHTLKNSLICNLLKVKIMMQQGLYNDAIRLVNHTYNKSLELKENLLAFDTLALKVRSLLWLYRSDEALEKIKDGEELLKAINQEILGDHKLRESEIHFLKAFFYYLKNDADKAEEHSDFCLALREELNFKQGLVEVLIMRSWIYSFLKGNLDNALKAVELGISLAKEFNYKFFIAFGLENMGTIYNFKGEIKPSTIAYEQSLSIYKELNNRRKMATILNNIGWAYTVVRDLDRSIKYLEQSLTLNRELGLDMNIALSLINIIINSIENQDLEKANQYFNDLEKMEICSKSNYVNRWYRFCKAFLLKTSLRAPHRGEAEVILKQILNEEFDDYELQVLTLLNLSELLLIEVRLLNDLQVLKELESLISRLLDIAEKNKSYYLLTEIYYLQGKLTLLTLDTKEARKFLTQAQRIAERWDYNELANNISIELDKLNNQLNMWDDLREEEISLSERIKLAGMDEQMEHLLWNRVSLTTQVKEQQITIHKERKICIVCKGDILGFMYACNCDALYCEKCARALTEIENACWVCGTPIDITKPIKPFKQEELGDKEIIKGKKKE